MAAGPNEGLSDSTIIRAYILRAHLAAQLLYYFQIEFLKAKTQDPRYCISTKKCCQTLQCYQYLGLLDHGVHTSGCRCVEEMQ